MGSLVSGAVLAVPALLAAGALPNDVTTADVCDTVPGAEIARALGGSLGEAMLIRPGGTHARCRYTVTVPGKTGPEKAVILVWLHPAGSFDDLRKYQDNPVQPTGGLGDAAFVAFDKDSGRYDLFVLLRPVATVETTGPSLESVRAAASVAIGALRPSRTR